MRKRKGKYKHLTLEKRYTIERMLEGGFRIADIAVAIGCCIATVYNEKKRFTYKHTKDYRDVIKYAPETVHERYRKNLKLKGKKPVLLEDVNQRNAIEKLILEKNYIKNPKPNG